MSGRLVVVSNRIPLHEAPSGGLVVALHDLLRKRGGVWIGADEQDRPKPRRKLVEHPAEGYAKMSFDLTAEDRECYYLGFSNAVLWPLCHRRADLIDYRPEFWRGYHRVNARLSKLLADILHPEDTLWIHDYHLFPLAAMLRERGVGNRMGFFLHIPFPTATDLDTMTERDEILRWIASYDLVGLQSRNDVGNCLTAYRGHDRGELYSDGTLGYRGRQFSVRSFPIGIAPQDFAEAATHGDGARMVNLAPGARLIIGADRLDYSKGIPHRLRAFETWLSQRDETAPRATLVQIAPPSREALGAYEAIRLELERTAGAINSEYGGLDWTPIRYLHRNVPREQLAPLFRAADVGLVTPLADGMNLVAKEFIAAQDPDDPGVLVLSRLAGAAEQLGSSVIVNPYDRTQTAEGIARALAMPLEERRDRHADARRSVFTEDISYWAESYLAALDGVPTALDARA